jgi:hypothetical protein
MTALVQAKGEKMGGQTQSTLDWVGRSNPGSWEYVFVSSSKSSDNERQNWMCDYIGKKDDQGIFLGPWLEFRPGHRLFYSVPPGEFPNSTWKWFSTAFLPHSF